MSTYISGAGWVTPLGTGVTEVWERLLKGDKAAAEQISDPVSDKSFRVFRVPETALSDLPKHPRLRRASAISRFGAAAGLAALGNAASTTGKIDMTRVALVFAVSNGGVVYTKRFFHDVVRAGTLKASPLLFPETVFNAPASHLAAILGLEGVSYTLVSDGAVGISAIQMAEDLLTWENIDYVLVVAPEEADWLLCDAYDKWRLLRNMTLSEGAGAVLIGRHGEIEIEKTNAGLYYNSHATAEKCLRQIARDLATPDCAIVITSANGTFVDRLEEKVLNDEMPKAADYSLKSALGESVGASALWQVIAATQALRTKRLPPGRNVEARHALVLSCGLNQQVAGVRLSI
jgi:3-oxoacyl-(acyl-carrier-protein) synthase